MFMAVSIASVCGLVAADSQVVGSAFSSTQAATRADNVLGGLRRLTEAQYRNSIADIFGPNITVAGRFEPEARIDGLLATGSAVLSVTPAGFESYVRMAESVGAQVVNEKNRAKLIPCTPKNASAPDAACAQQVLRQYGRLIFRRPLTGPELASRVALASKVATNNKDFYAGVGSSIASLLMAQEFLFRVELADQTPDGLSLESYSRAQRISFLLWNAPPDNELLRAAAAGELKTETGLRTQVDRMMASPRLDAGMRAFFEDMMQLDRFETLSKDSVIFPNYSERVASSAHEETLRMVLDHTLKQDADYRDLLTTRKTYLNRTLASIYNVPFGFKGEWQPYEFSQDAGRSGILTQATFLSLFSHPGRSSPTLRGVALREIFMCDPTPPPPANVDFSIINGDGNPELKTVRARLSAHATDPTCASCHNRSDPVGLSLENFDSIGQYRVSDNGEPVDASAKIGQQSFVGAQALGVILRNDPKLTSCVARNLSAYGSGTKSGDLDPQAFAAAEKAFSGSGFKLRALLRATLTSENFYRLLPHPEETVVPQQIAAN
jgi:hypothetical protein